MHSAACHLGEDNVVTATIATAEMEKGLARLMLAGINPDIVIPAALAISPPEQIVAAEFDGIAMLRGPTVAAPDEPLFRNLLVGQDEVELLGSETVRAMLIEACESPLLNLREGPFAKRERRELATDSQREWIKRLVAGLAVASLLLALVTLGKYWVATDAENDRALAAAQKIDPSIIDVTQAEAQVDRALCNAGWRRGASCPCLRPVAHRPGIAQCVGARAAATVLTVSSMSYSPRPIQQRQPRARRYPAGRIPHHRDPAPGCQRRDFGRYDDEDAMIQSLRTWFYALSEREQWLVGVAGALAALVLLVFAIILPILGAVDDAIVAHDEAVARRGRIEATGPLLCKNQPSRLPQLPTSIWSSRKVRRRKVSTSIASTGGAPGQATFRIDQARAPALLAG